MSSLPPNLHHLELFYYVAKYGGITPAVRKMPYGIQQPAVSGQMLQLEPQRRHGIARASETTCEDDRKQ